MPPKGRGTKRTGDEKGGDEKGTSLILEGSEGLVWRIGEGYGKGDITEWHQKSGNLLAETTLTGVLSLLAGMA